MKKATKAKQPAGAQQFTAAQLIQMEMAQELVEKKKLCEQLQAKAEEDAAKLEKLEAMVKTQASKLSQRNAAIATLTFNLKLAEPSWKESTLAPLEPAKGPACPVDRLSQAAITAICTQLSAADICHFGAVCKYLHKLTASDGPPPQTSRPKNRT